jgi:hypothetical protein
MNSYRDYNIVHAAVDRASSAAVELRQADRDVAKYCDGMAFDGNSASEVYRAGLEHLGVPTRELAGLSASALRVLLKGVRTAQASHGVTPAMAMDASEGSSALSSILRGIEPPKDISTRSDRLR